MSLSIQIDPAHDGGDGDGGNKSAGRWTQEEHNMFLQGLQTHQKQWKLIADMVKTRTVVQIRTHAQKYFQKLHKTSGWSKHERMDDPASPFSEHDGQRNFAYPVADTRANSFSSGDSIDSNGTSAEGGDSEGELHGGQRHPQQQNRPRPLPNASYAFDHNAGSGSTSTSNSTLSSPTAAGYHNSMFGAPPGQTHHPAGGQLPLSKRPQPLNVLKVKGELVRKRSRDSIKAMLPGDGKPAAHSPKKSNYADKARPDPDVHPGRSHSGSSPNVAFRTNVFGGAHHDNYGGCLPGPLMGLPDDLGVGLGLGLDVGHDLYFPSGTFPDDPSTCGYGTHLSCPSNDTELTNPSAHYFSQMMGAAGGWVDHEHGQDTPDFDDSDFINILETIDWTEPMAQGHAESVSSVSTNSRPLSPVTDSASTVSAVPRPPFQSAGVAVAPTVSVKQEACPVPASACTTTDLSIEDAPVPKKHRVAFSSVIEELQLVSQAVRDNSSSSGAAQNDADHISLFDLFQRDGSETIGRLPPLRALVEQARERSLNKGQVKVECVDGNTTAGVAASGVDFDAHDFDFNNFMGEDFQEDSHAMDCGATLPLTHSAPLPPPPAPAVRSGSSGNLFASGTSILDANGALNPSGTLLTLTMMPSSTAPSSANNTPVLVQRKRGRPRKHSLGSAPTPVGTPGAATAKSLLPALTHSVIGQQFQAHSLPEGQGYIVPVNSNVAQAYSYAVSSTLGGGASDYSPQNARSVSGDSTSSAGSHLTAFRLSTQSLDAPQPYHGYGTNVRLGMTRTMSSESDNMMAAAFDLKLYDRGDMGMLEDFE